MNRRVIRPPAGEFPLVVDRLGHDGRGIGVVDGKTVFVEGALPTEAVMFRYAFRRKTFDEGYVVDVQQASPERVEPVCPHVAVCGGCSLQHLAVDAQLALKQSVLLEQLHHFGNVVPREILPPLVGDRTGYRHRARLAVRHVQAKGGVLVGFREKRSNYVADIDSCAVLLPAVGRHIAELRTLLSSLSASDKIPQVEVAAGDDDIALVFRHLVPLIDSDRDAIAAWCRTYGFHCWLQPGNESTMHRVWPEHHGTAGGERLAYRLDDFGVELLFHPGDFTQVNPSVNRQMVRNAIDLLDPQQTDRVLDLFCGLGNFTLPLATRAAQVTGVEGSAAMVARGHENAKHNAGRMGVGAEGHDKLRFFAADLDGDLFSVQRTGRADHAAWVDERYDCILLDPPRSGALAVVQSIARFGARRLVYVSCNPATLARDAGELVRQGYVLDKVGVIDMFPHTAHVESMALFVKSKDSRNKRNQNSLRHIG